jgi:hypothetical protein
MSKQRRVKLTHREVRWDDLDLSEWLNFQGGWRVPETDFERSRSRWQTWQEFLQCWALVREDGLAAWEETRAGQRRTFRRAVDEALPFAERLYRAVEAGADPEVWAAERTQARYEEHVRDLESALGRDPDDRALWAAAPEGDDGDA